MSELAKPELTPLELELSKIAAKFLELPAEFQAVDSSLIEAANKWEEAQKEIMRKCGVISDIDSASMERGKMIYLHMMLCHRDLMVNGLFIENENGDRKENPAGSALRAWSNQMEKWEGQHAAYPLARHNKNINLEKPTGKSPSHGNKKYANSINLINGIK